MYFVIQFNFNFDLLSYFVIIFLYYVIQCAEVIIHLPRGSDPAPELAPRATPMDPGAVSEEADMPRWVSM